MKMNISKSPQALGLSTRILALFLTLCLLGGMMSELPLYIYAEGTAESEPTPTDPTPEEETASPNTTPEEGSNPTDPTPADPEPTEPTPTEPEPTEPTPTEPEPTDPIPTEPTPAGDIVVDETNFPDPIFLDVIRYLLSDYVSDGILTQNEIANIVSLDISSFEITDLTGIQYFTDLTVLNCSDNLLTSLDVSGLANLTDLTCSDNDLISLDMSGLTQLTHVECSYNALTTINTDGCTSLKYLYAAGNAFTSFLLRSTSLDWLDLSLNYSLLSIDLEGCSALRTLLIDACTALQTLNISDTGVEGGLFARSTLTTLDVGGCAGLTALIGVDQCSQLSVLDVSGTQITELFLPFTNVLTSLNISNCTQLREVVGLSDCDSLESLYATDATALESISVYSGYLSTLELDGCTALTDLYLYWMESLTSLDVNGCTALTTLVVDNAPTIRSINVSGCIALTDFGYNNCENLEELNISGSGIATLDFSNNSKLHTLNAANCAGLSNIWGIESTALQSLDVSGCTSLPYLYLDNLTALQSVKLAGCSALGALSLYGLSALRELDASNLPALYSLYVRESALIQSIQADHNPLLTDFLIENCAALKHADATDSLLSNFISISGCPMLESLKLANSSSPSLANVEKSILNQLKVLDISGTPITSITFSDAKLERFHASHTPLKSFESYTCRNLIELDLSYSAIRSLMVSTYHRLESLKIEGCANLEEFTANFHDSTLTALNLEGLTALTELRLNDIITLKALQLSHHPVLSILQITNAPELVALDISSYNTLTELDIISSGVAELTLGAHPLLQNIDLKSSAITELKLTGCEALTRMNLYGCNSLRVLELIGLSALNELDLTGTDALESVTVKDCDALTALIIPGAPQLKTLRCTGSADKTVVVSCRTLDIIDVSDHICLITVRTENIDHTPMEVPAEANISQNRVYLNAWISHPTGYSFIGWYDANDPTRVLHTYQIYDFDPTVSIDMIAVFEQTTNATVVLDGGRSNFTVNGEEKAAECTLSYALGEVITVEVLDSADFAYWKDQKGSILSRSPSYTFTVVENIVVTAVFNTPVEGKKIIIFESAYGQIIYRDQLSAAEAEGLIFPTVPYKAGCDAGTWSMTPEALQAAFADDRIAVITIKPVYPAATEKFTVTVVGGTVNNTDGLTEMTDLKNTAVTVTADTAPTGLKFAYWTDAAGNILSYNSQYTFFLTEDETLTAVFLEYFSTWNTLGMATVTDVIKNTENGKLSVVSMFNVTEGYTIDFAGIIASADPAHATNLTAENAPIIRGDSADELSYRYTWTVGNSAEKALWVRAYMVCSDNWGTYIVYGDIVAITYSET